MIEAGIYRGIAITRLVIIRHQPSQIEGQSVVSRINDRLRLSFNSNGRNAILIEESSWLLEWNRTIHDLIDLSIITCTMCNTDAHVFMENLNLRGIFDRISYSSRIFDY